MLRSRGGVFVSLTNFRLYRLDGAGKITTAEWLSADDEDHALQLAREMKLPTAVEIWDRNRLVGRVDPVKGA